jgi:hypothetical protein
MDRRQRVDAAETPRPAHGFAVRRRLRDAGQPGIEVAEPRLELLNRQLIIVDNAPLGWLRLRQAIDPPSMSLRRGPH